MTRAAICARAYTPRTRKREATTKKRKSGGGLESTRAKGARIFAFSGLCEVLPNLQSVIDHWEFCETDHASVAEAVNHLKRLGWDESASAGVARWYYGPPECCRLKIGFEGAVDLWTEAQRQEQALPPGFRMNPVYLSIDDVLSDYPTQRFGGASP